MKPYSKKPKRKRDGNMAQVVEHLPNRHRAQSSKLQYCINK
jgi:hypothetical protein